MFNWKKKVAWRKEKHHKKKRGKQDRTHSIPGKIKHKLLQLNPKSTCRPQWRWEMLDVEARHRPVPCCRWRERVWQLSSSSRRYRPVAERLVDQSLQTSAPLFGRQLWHLCTDACCSEDILSNFWRSSETCQLEKDSASWTEAGRSSTTKWASWLRLPG